VFLTFAFKLMSLPQDFLYMCFCSMKINIGYFTRTRVLASCRLVYGCLLGMHWRGDFNWHIAGYIGHDNAAKATQRARGRPRR